MYLNSPCVRLEPFSWILGRHSALKSASIREDLMLTHAKLFQRFALSQPNLRVHQINAETAMVKQ